MTDMSDAAWLCQLAEAGLLRANFVPPKPIRDLRQLTRYRKTQIAERQREAQRLHKALEDTNIKLDCVASDLLGTSGRAMLDALVAGTTDPEILAKLAKGRLRQKLPALREALEGRFDELHALLIGAILAHLDFLDEQIERLSDAIEERIAPFERAVELLCTIPGVQRPTAQVIIAETGPDMTVFPSARHLASWAGQCPGNDRSAGKQRSGRTRTGSRWLNAALKDAAMAAIRTKNTYLRALYERQRSRIGHGKSDRRRQALDARRRLAHAHHRRALRRPRIRLPRSPRPRPHDQAPRRPARTPRSHRHPPGGSRIGRERVYPSVGLGPATSWVPIQALPRAEFGDHADPVSEAAAG
jgi:transposase